MTTPSRPAAATRPSTSRRGPRCPNCGKPAQGRGNPARPFCSVRCKLVDLGGWLDEAYRIAGEPPAGEPTRRRSGPEESR